MKTLRINIGEDGSATLETSGCRGTECKDLSKGIEKALGEVVSETAKPEMQLPNESPNINQAGR